MHKSDDILGKQYKNEQSKTISEKEIEWSSKLSPSYFVQFFLLVFGRMFCSCILTLDTYF